ncbi:MAG: acyl-CoA dehydrogenase family protein, partial [Calditrichaeota bacterium]
MNFSLNEEQLALQKEIIQFARKELNDGLIEKDRQATFPRENWKKCAEFGILGLPFPARYGGSDADIIT